MVKEKICIICGKKFELKDDAPYELDKCVCCLFKDLLRKIGRD